MDRTIWKAILKPVELQEIEAPAGAEFLCAREQFEQVCIWFRCDPKAAIEKRKIAIIGTGHVAPIDGAYIGTAFLHGGQLVLHVFNGPAPQTAE